MTDSGRTCRSIMILTGAGISAESGLPVFRGEGGWWEGFRAIDLATPDAFRRNPALVHRFYNFRRRMLQDESIVPNQAHLALANLQQLWNGPFSLVTQNVDNLHERAGSTEVLHLHGELTRARCLDTGEVFDWTGDLDLQTPHPFRRNCPGRLRPHIVWFGETPLHLEAIGRLASRCDLFVAIGSSGVVWPAAGIAQWTPPHCRRILVNLEQPENSGMFEEQIYGPASQTVPELCRNLLQCQRQ